MNEESRFLYYLMIALVQNPEDSSTRSALADWLDEHDEPELAEVHRAFCREDAKKKREAKKRLREVANRYAGGDYDGMVKGVLEGAYCFSDDDYYEIDLQELCDDVETVTGKEPDPDSRDRSSGSFRCAC